MRRRLCFVVNPLAGIGGPLALKGSDGQAGLIALERGATLVSPQKATRFLSRLKTLGINKDLDILTAGGLMGEKEAAAAGLRVMVVYRPRGWPTHRQDTIAAVKNCIKEGSEIVVFVGGDGTARDVLEALGSSHEVPVLGVPAGVKMYSSVYAETPEAAADVLWEWLHSGGLCEAEVLDIDEEAFRAGELSVKLYGVALVPCSSKMVGSSKQPSLSSPDEEENKQAIAKYVAESMKPCTLYILGPGSTVKAIADEIGVKKTLLGVDVVHNGRVIALDVDEEKLYEIVRSHLARGGSVKLIVTPIGGQGYILGRGNQQISPRVLRLIGKDGIVVVATRNKLQHLRKLRVDTGDPELDQELRGYIRVVVDYREELMIRVD
ncbi:MAG TPA: ATP-NAD kinase [Pyrodictium delaneyi]|uniref:ATP-NAD kinase n=1 Tax=Pyrodictium delaneyi TaxID=1273541 RepID=A0A832ZSI0_9CREN|nr:ATP-NAD kinase [Pyrodictium delaneyi]